jgi:formate hydrogenlyase subunit 4
MQEAIPSIVQLAAALALAPLLPAIINRVKAAVAGRRGAPILQGYVDLAKLLSKSAVYSRTTGLPFRAGPVVGLAAAACALTLLPWAGQRALLAFDGDLILFASLFALMRFFTITAALDTGSSFEGMGASREAAFSALSEPALLLGLAALARRSGSISLSSILPGQGIGTGSGAALLLAAGAVFIVLLAECARIPVDDPATHLELTMIHEVMVLDHCGIDLAYIEYGSALKLWAIGGLAVAALLPHKAAGAGSPWIADAGLALAGMVCLAAAVGIVESVMARLRLARVPQLLVAALAMSALALALVFVRQ